MSKEECQFRVKKYSLFTNIGNHSTKGAILKAMPIIVFKYGGKILFAAGFLDSVVDIYHAKDKVRETVLLGFSWAGAAAGATPTRNAYATKSRQKWIDIRGYRMI